MKISELREEYNSRTKCVAIYSNSFGIQQGTILDRPVLYGKRYKVAIDSYQNMVPLADIVSIKDTKESW